MNTLTGTDREKCASGRTLIDMGVSVCAMNMDSLACKLNVTHKIDYIDFYVRDSSLDVAQS